MEIPQTRARVKTIYRCHQFGRFFSLNTRLQYQKSARHVGCSAMEEDMNKIAIKSPGASTDPTCLLQRLLLNRDVGRLEIQILTHSSITVIVVAIRHETLGDLATKIRIMPKKVGNIQLSYLGLFKTFAQIKYKFYFIIFLSSIYFSNLYCF